MPYKKRPEDHPLINLDERSYYNSDIINNPIQLLDPNLFAQYTNHILDLQKKRNKRINKYKTLNRRQNIPSSRRFKDRQNLKNEINDLNNIINESKKRISDDLRFGDEDRGIITGKDNSLKRLKNAKKNLIKNRYIPDLSDNEYNLLQKINDRIDALNFINSRSKKLNIIPRF